MNEARAQRQSNTDSAIALLPALRRFFRRRAPIEAVEDLVQEVFVGLHARKAESPIENDEAYIFTVARHVLARHWQRGRGAAMLGTMLEAEEICDPEPRADRRALDKESLDQALQAIETMPARTRDIFLMHRFDDMTYAAIARHIGISTSAVEKHIMAALQALCWATGRIR